MRAAWLGGLSAAWMAASWPAHRRFRHLLDHPEQAQGQALARVLEGARGSAYGRAHGLDRVRTPAELQAAAPLTTYDALHPWIERVKNGEAGVLSTQPVLMLETTGGSSAAAKYIPYTAGLRSEFNRALQPWMYDLYTARPRLLTCATYWSISPAGRTREQTAGGVPVGFEDDTEYFGGLERFVMGQLMPTPPAVARLDVDGNRHATLLYLLSEQRLGLISVWNPSFLTLLMDFLDRHAEVLIRDIAQGTISIHRHAGDAPDPGGAPALRRAPQRARARELERLLSAHGRLEAEHVWPHLSVVSCWASASATLFLPALRARFPRAEIQPKGLLATEGVVSIPLWDRAAPVLALDSHFYEFVPAAGGAPLLAHQLEVGGQYAVVISTSGGLYRYQLRDEVRVAGHLGRTPLLDFCGRAPGTSDLCGEKLSEELVSRVVAAALAAEDLRASFVVLAPWMEEPPRYVLHVESAAADAVLERAADRIEEGLLANPHYAYCRRLGQLAPIAAFRIARDGAASYLAACVARGQKAGSVKPAVLERQATWETAFEGTRLIR